MILCIVVNCCSKRYKNTLEGAFSHASLFVTRLLKYSQCDHIVINSRSDYIIAIRCCSVNQYFIASHNRRRLREVIAELQLLVKVSYFVSFPS